MDGKVIEYDVVILGSGPAGLQAAVHSSRARVRTAVLGRMQSSSLFKAHIENYCCMSGPVTGEKVLSDGRDQAKRSGASLIDEDVLSIERTGDGRFRVKLESGDTLVCWSVILAMGISRNRLNVPGEKELLGKGVSYCVDCDANFFRNEPVAVVGDGSAAAYGALTLLMIASEVHLVCRSLGVAENLQYQVEASGIKVHSERSVREIVGKNAVEGLVLDTGEKLEVTGVFIELGAKGAVELTSMLDVALDRESMRYIATNKKQETNIPGLYAAGDICGPPWQMAKAVGEGCVAGLEASGYSRREAAKKAG